MRAYIHALQGELLPEPHPMGDAVRIELQVTGDLTSVEKHWLLEKLESREVVEVRLNPPPVDLEGLRL